MAILVPTVGLMHVLMRDPLFYKLFEFPMALAPTFLVPTLVMMNMLVAWRLVEKRISAESVTVA